MRLSYFIIITLFLLAIPKLFDDSISFDRLSSMSFALIAVIPCMMEWMSRIWELLRVDTLADTAPDAQAGCKAVAVAFGDPTPATSSAPTPMMVLPFTFSERESNHTFSYHQQVVSDIAIWWKAASSSFHMTNREWVTFHPLVKGGHITSLWWTASEWHCTLCERQSHHIFSYD